MLKKIMHSALFLIGLAAIITVTSAIVKPKSEIYDLMAVEGKLKELENEKDNSIDLVFIGDSEAYSAYNPLQMYDEYGFTSYVCGTSAQRLCDSYVILREVFKRQSPKVVAVETNSLFRFGGLSDESGDKVLNFVSKYIPAIKYHTRLKVYITGGPVKNDGNMKGFIYRTQVVPYTGGEWMKRSEASDDIHPCNLEYLKKMYDLAEENGAKLIFISTPSPVCQTYERHNAVSALARELGTDYIDMNLNVEELGLDWQKDTRDAGNHLNYYGAKKVSSYIGNILSRLYELPDHREDGSYQSWKQALINSGLKP